jgi:hypothetical protein
VTHTVTAGTLTVSGSGQLNSGSYAGAISNSGTFNYSSSADQVFTANVSKAGALSGAGTYTFSGSGTVTLTGDEHSRVPLMLHSPSL